MTSGTGSGIYIAGDGAKVQSSTALANWYGIFVEGAKAWIQSSTASGNEHVGIRVHGDEPEVKGNRAEANGFEHGTTSNYDGTGIWLTGHDTSDRQEHRARQRQPERVRPDQPVLTP